MKLLLCEMCLVVHMFNITDRLIRAALSHLLCTLTCPVLIKMRV